MVKLSESYLRLPIWKELERGRITPSFYPTIKPTKLVELEEFANVAVKHMSNSTTTPETLSHLRQRAMNQIRHVFNLEFKMCCQVCGMTHNQDEISAPER